MDHRNPVDDLSISREPGDNRTNEDGLNKRRLMQLSLDLGMGAVYQKKSALTTCSGEGLTFTHGVQAYREKFHDLDFVLQERSTICIGTEAPEILAQYDRSMRHLTTSAVIWLRLPQVSSNFTTADQNQAAVALVELLSRIPVGLDQLDDTWRHRLVMAALRHAFPGRTIITLSVPTIEPVSSRYDVVRVSFPYYVAEATTGNTIKCSTSIALPKETPAFKPIGRVHPIFKAEPATGGARTDLEQSLATSATIIMSEMFSLVFDEAAARTYVHARFCQLRNMRVDYLFVDDGRTLKGYCNRCIALGLDCELKERPCSQCGTEDRCAYTLTMRGLPSEPDPYVAPFAIRQSGKPGLLEIVLSDELKAALPAMSSLVLFAPISSKSQVKALVAETFFAELKRNGSTKAGLMAVAMKLDRKSQW